MEQNLFFFHQKSEGIAFTLCRYLYQKYEGICILQVLSSNCILPSDLITKKSSKIEGNTLGILRRSFFPFNALSMPSFNNSVYLESVNFPKILDCTYTIDLVLYFIDWDWSRRRLIDRTHWVKKNSEGVFFLKSRFS